MDHFDPDLRCSSLEEADYTRNHQDRKDKDTQGSRNYLAQWAGVQAGVEAAHNYVGGIEFVAADFAVAVAAAVDDDDAAAAAGSGGFAA